MALQQGSVQDQGCVPSLSLGNPREEEGKNLPFPSTSYLAQRLHIFSMHKCAYLQIKKNRLYAPGWL